MKITVILADDHKLFRDGVRALLEKYEDIQVIAEAQDGLELIEEVEKLKPDIVLADISMPNLSGLDSIEKITSISPSTRVILLTMHEDGNYILKSVEAGASAYLLKNVDEEELIITLRKVASGEKYFNPKISQLMIENISKAKKEENQVNLTEREKEILSLVADGLSTKMIADKLFLSSRTVETHRVNIMKKFKAHNTAELVRKAIELNIL